MMRYLFNLLLFLLPFIVYGGYALVMRRLRPAETKDWSEAPFAWLVFAGFAIGIAGIVAAAFWSGQSVDEAYVPKRLIDGEIVRGPDVPGADNNETGAGNDE